MWDRFVGKTSESEIDDDAFSRRLLLESKDLDYWTRLFIHKAGSVDEYKYFSVEIVDGCWEPKNAGVVIERSVSQVLEAAKKATVQWHEDFRTLLQTLKCTKKELLRKLAGPQPEKARVDPVPSLALL